jgi:hypothetical protein
MSLDPVLDHLGPVRCPLRVSVDPVHELSTAVSYLLMHLEPGSRLLPKCSSAAPRRCSRSTMCDHDVLPALCFFSRWSRTSTSRVVWRFPTRLLPLAPRSYQALMLPIERKVAPSAPPGLPRVDVERRPLSRYAAIAGGAQ